MITRLCSSHIHAHLFQGKTLIISGPRQVGKTTMMKQFVQEYRGLYINAELINEQEWLLSRNKQTYAQYLSNYTLVVIDEAHHVNEIGIIGKIIHDEFPNIQLIMTGSSSFLLGQYTSEPMTGRTRSFTLLPVAYTELIIPFSMQSFVDSLENRQRYGMYPDVLTSKSALQKTEIIGDITQAYLFKDILQFEGVKKSDTIIKLAKLLAFQIGQEVSINELASQLNISAHTAERYCQILEEAYIIFRVGAYAKNLRKELSKSKKFYFWDLGIRNSLLGMHQPMNQRADMGAIRENFVFAELKKQILLYKTREIVYFWRTTDGQEIDCIITNTQNTMLYAYEIKKNDTKKATLPKIFLTTYSDSITGVITPQTFHSIVGKQRVVA